MIIRSDAKVERRYQPPDYKVRVEGGTDGKPLRLVGYAALFESLSVEMVCFEGPFREVLTRGCFAESLKLTDIPALYNHDDRLILARMSNGLKLFEDEVGLGYESPVPATSYGADLVENIRNGNLTGCSFGFVPVVERVEEPTDDGTIIRRLDQVRLVEISLGVTFPAYIETTVGIRSIASHLAARSANPVRRTRLEKIRRFLDLSAN